MYEWLILPFGIENNLFELLCIKVIFNIINILFLIDYWYCCFTSKLLWQIENLKSDKEVFLGFWPKQ